MRLSEYVEHDATGLAALVEAGETTPAELAACAGEAMDAVNAQLNAVIRRVSDAGAPRGPFHGVPFLLKDLGHNWAGIPCTMGSRIGAGFVPESDGPLAARLRASGLVPVGVTNSSEFGINGVTEPAAYGATRNPWNPALSPGGSSGGSAAAVAAGIVPMAHATDGGGSIRVPAAWCGLVGLKPSRGRNPLGSGASNDGAHWVTAQHVVSRSLRDTARALDVTAGPVPGDYMPTARPDRSFVSEIAQPCRPLHIALVTGWLDGPAVDPACRDAAMRAARVAESRGHIVEAARPDIPYPAMSDLCRDLFLPTLAEGVEATAQRTGLVPGPDTLEPQTLAALDAVGRLDALDLKRRLSELAAMSREVGCFMERFDVILSPAASTLPPAIGAFDASRYPAGSLEFWADEMRCYAFSALPSLTGQPAMTLPLHESAEGLPVGVQIAGRIGEEAMLFRLAAQFEAEMPWHHRRPAIHAARQPAMSDT